MVAPVLTAAQKLAYEKTLLTVHTFRVRASIIDRNFKQVVTLDDQTQPGGQVVVDSTADVWRSCTLSFLDPDHALGFDSDTYQGQELNLSRQLRVRCDVDSPLLDKPAAVYLHTGPVTRLTRKGPVVTVEAQGREAYGLTPLNRTITIRKGGRRTDAIRTLLRAMGETRFGAIPTSTSKLPADVVCGPADKPWTKARSIASSMGYQLFYGADGVPYMRTLPTKPVWTFRDGEGGSIKSDVTTTADLTDVRNQVKVTGATPSGKKNPVTGVATAPATHPLSPWNLGPTGAPMWLIEEISNDNLRTALECRQFAESMLAAKLRLNRSAQFDAVRVPHLDAGDLIGVESYGEQTSTRLDQFQISLDPGGQMNVGYIDTFAGTAHKTRKVK